MSNGGVKRSGAGGQPNIPEDPMSGVGAKGVAGSQDVSTRTDSDKSVGENSADNAVALKQQAMEKGSLQDLVGKLLNADLNLLLKKTQGSSFNDEISKQIKEIKLGGELLGDPKSAAALVRNPEIFGRILREGSKETKQLLGNAILDDPNLTNTQKLEVLKQLTEPPKDKAQANAVTMNDIVRNATPEGLKGLGRLAAGIMQMPVGEARSQLYDLLRGVDGSAMSKALTQISFDKTITDDQKTKMTGALFMSTNPKEIGSVFSQQTSNQFLQKALTSDSPEGVFVKLSHSIKPEHVGHLVDVLANSSPPKVDMLARQFPLSSPALTNAAIDRMQEVGQLEKFLRNTSPGDYFKDLTPQNAGAISAEYSRMAEAEKDPNLAKEWKQRAMNLDGYAENRLAKNDYEEYARVRDRYHR